jgi:hypothetical protein
MRDGRPLGFRDRQSSAEATEVGAPALPVLDDRAAAGLLPERPARAHKGTFGKVLVLAGSLDYAGAALLVCRAAGRAGAGLVTLAVPESLQPLFAAKVIEATTMALPEDDVEELDPEPALARILDHDHDAIVVGPACVRASPPPSSSASSSINRRIPRPRPWSSTPRRCDRWRPSGRGGTASPGNAS